MNTIVARVALLVCCASAARAQATTPPPPGTPPLFTRNDAIWSAAFLVGSIALSTADVSIARVWNDSAHRSPSRDNLARNFAKIQEGTLTVGNLALWGIARLAKMPAMADITFHAAESVVIGSATAQVIRGPLGRSRPHVTGYEDQYDFHYFRGFREFAYRAFPSIHTASAFAVATVYTLETKRRAPDAVWIVAPVAYLLAAGPGISRMYTGQHWASDILAGAFVGTFAAAKVVRYNHDVDPDNRVNRFFLGSRNVQVGVAQSGVTVAYRRIF
jgi:membrane-associated phospholipid phosphatase